MDEEATLQSTNETTVQIQRLIDWNCEILLRLLKQVVAKRLASGKTEWEEEPILQQEEGKFIFDEVTETIDLPDFDKRTYPNASFIELDPEVVSQLHEFVFAVANAYHRNPFHCLHHASQVTTAASKLLSRIVVSEFDDGEIGVDTDLSKEEKVEVTESIASHLHNHTYGITSDPLTRFSVVLSAFIHAVDHRGVSNAQLVKEEPEASAMYKNRSITEQRSLDKAWKKLMEPNFRALRRCIYSDEIELKRFRQVVVNAVLATDIEDEELQSLRMARWLKTFRYGAMVSTAQDVNRKATIVIEHIMQASDIFHCMQPWIIYEKWIKRLFEEKYIAFKNGRSDENPTVSFYRKELEFFDNYVIPLTMQLKDCDAFVVSSEEYLNYALKNRQRLAATGKSFVAAMVAKLDESGDKTTISRQDSLGPVISADNNSSNEAADAVPKHIQRLIDWNVEMLQRLLKDVVANRNVSTVVPDKLPTLSERPDGQIIVDEYVEIITLAEPIDDGNNVDDNNHNEHNTNDDNDDNNNNNNDAAAESITLSDAAASQLREFVTDIASKFQNNSFHCLDHGSHVCMTTRKLLSRIISQMGSDPATLHRATFGISSDPLAQFAVVFAALIHDADHSGVPNSQLVIENSDLAARYKNRCILEQHSIDLAWNHLMKPGFEDLRASIYTNEAELKRFRQIVVNCVLATDNVDEELMTFRKSRWEKAFGENCISSNEEEEKQQQDDDGIIMIHSPLSMEEELEDRNRKATAVLELVMQISDAFHATQNWHLYQKWNERNFQESYRAYQAGRLRQDPSIFWYKRELLFFDNDVIPMMKKLTECGLFGISADEYLGFALSNRQQWAAKGGDLVASMMARLHGDEVQKARAKRIAKRLSLSAKQA